MHNYFDIDLRSSVGNLAAIKSACMASMYYISGYHDNYLKSADTWCHCQKVNKTTPTTINQRMIYPLMLAEKFWLFINPLASLR